jgi:hypothetical protein
MLGNQKCIVIVPQTRTSRKRSRPRFLDGMTTTRPGLVSRAAPARQGINVMVQDRHGPGDRPGQSAAADRADRPLDLADLPALRAALEALAAALDRDQPDLDAFRAAGKDLKRVLRPSGPCRLINLRIRKAQLPRKVRAELMGFWEVLMYPGVSELGGLERFAEERLRDQFLADIDEMVETLRVLNPNRDERLTFDDNTLTVTLDGTPHRIKDPKAYAVFKTICARDTSTITKMQIRVRVKGVAGRKTIPHLIGTLPPTLQQTVKVGTRGYWTELPHQPEK